MTLLCPKCGAPHPLQSYRAGAAFACGCGHLLSVPLSGEREWPKWRTGWLWVPLVAFVATPVVLVAIRSSYGFTDDVTAPEARTHVRALCEAAHRHFADTGEWLTAGPLPLAVPGKEGLPFAADDAFSRLGFAPARVHYQYEVTRTETGVACIARGRRTYRYEADGQGARWAVK